jgi:transcriptional regulator with XRE-family HTH domain
MYNREKVLLRLEQIIAESPYRTKTEFCQALGVSPQVLGNIQNPNNKDREIPKSILNGLAKLGYNLTWILFGAGDQKAVFKDQQEEIQALRKQISLLEQLVILREQDDQIRRKRHSEHGKN